MHIYTYTYLYININIYIYIYLYPTLMSEHVSQMRQHFSYLRGRKAS